MLPELPFTVGQPYKIFVLQKFEIFGFWFPSSRVCRGSGHAAHLGAVTGLQHQSRPIPAPRRRWPSPWPLRKHLGTPSRSRYPELPRCAAPGATRSRQEPPGAARREILPATSRGAPPWLQRRNSLTSCGACHRSPADGWTSQGTTDNYVDARGDPDYEISGDEPPPDWRTASLTSGPRNHAHGFAEEDDHADYHVLTGHR